jgi:hypothetical protein
MFLLVQPNGPKLWRLKYRFGGKEKLLSLGTLEDVNLKQARAKREDARRLLSAGTDPSEIRKAESAKEAARDLARSLESSGMPVPGTFEAVAREWHQRIACGFCERDLRTTFAMP